MLNTDKYTCIQLADLLAAYGIEDVVISPGTRNAPLIMAVARHHVLHHRMVVDERSAAFIALGIAAVTQKPVALICTSGTAVLNYAPAVAEAFYRGIPLIVISADRPAQWIDQDDSQTIRQPGVLHNIVKTTVDLGCDQTAGDDGAWYANRMINDALIAATTPHCGPVHINVHLDEPLTDTVDQGVFAPVRVVGHIGRPAVLPTAQVREIAAEIAAGKKVLFLCAFMQPDRRLSRAFAKLAAMPNVAVMCEAQSNLHCTGLIGNIDLVLGHMGKRGRQRLAPDTVVTVGGSLVSRHVKAWLRGLPDAAHWHIGERPLSIDCFRHLRCRVSLPPEVFVPQLASAMHGVADATSTYAVQWQTAAASARVFYDKWLTSGLWCDMLAIDMIVRGLDRRTNLQVSNGTCVRYLQLTDYSALHRIDCNRGVSGIDGCTSTAVGAAMAYNGPTVLITGDMSAQYDIGALATKGIPANMAVFVMSNGGGSIFRFIKPTRDLDEVEECFAMDVNVPLRQLADGYGWQYECAANAAELQKALDNLGKPRQKPLLVNVILPKKAGAEQLTAFFKANSGAMDNE